MYVSSYRPWVFVLSTLGLGLGPHTWRTMTPCAPRQNHAGTENAGVGREANQSA